jgi:S-formylglutathione hydrolase FrmB
VIDACLAKGMGQGGIFACGVSRAGYCALRLAATDDLIDGVAGLAPVVDWRYLREFVAVREDTDVALLALNHRAEALAGRAIFLAIGNYDQRVISAACVRFALRLAELEEAREMT